MKDSRQKVEKVFEYKLPIKIEPQKDGGYLATCPVWDDCYAQGDSISEVVSEINLVAQRLIEIHREEALPIPLDLDKAKKRRKVREIIDVPVFVTA